MKKMQKEASMTIYWTNMTIHWTAMTIPVGMAIDSHAQQALDCHARLLIDSHTEQSSGMTIDIHALHR